MKFILKACAILLASALAFAGQAGAQRLYDGISIAELRSMVSNLTINGQAVVITQRATPEGAPYLEITSDQIGAPMVASLIGAGYNRATSGAHGFQWLIFLNQAPRADATFINEFNQIEPYVKLYAPSPGTIMLKGEFVAAGGVTEVNIAAATAAFFIGMDALGEALTAPNTIASADAGKIKVSVARVGGDKRVPAANIAELKIANLRSILGGGDTAVLDILVHATVDTAAR
jgi:hypothetical protein